MVKHNEPLCRTIMYQVPGIIFYIRTSTCLCVRACNLSSNILLDGHVACGSLSLITETRSSKVTDVGASHLSS